MVDSNQVWSVNETIEYINQLKQFDRVFICLHGKDGEDGKIQKFLDKHDGREMPNAKKYENCLVRLPLWVNMNDSQVNHVIQKVLEFYKK